MERLEHALDKARQARRRRLTRGAAPGGGPGPRPGADPQAPSGWEGLTEITISPRQAARHRLGALQGAATAAPYDILRARVLRQMREAGWRRLVITSPNKGCGKSTISANLALSLARQPAMRVILVDFDLRRPMLAQMFGAQAQAGNIGDLLQGRSDFATHALRYGPNLALGLNRAPVPHSAEILHSHETGEFLNRLEATWKPDLILFDTPPMLGNDDTLGFLQFADSALLVAAAGQSTLAQIDSCERELSNMTSVVGTVLNKCRYLDDADGYGYGYY